LSERYNENQADYDGDWIGDLCDSDDDNDGVPDVSDNCDLRSNPSQTNNDTDTLGNAAITVFMSITTISLIPTATFTVMPAIIVPL